MAVLRLGYVHVRVTDLEDGKRHYSDTLGMKIMADEGGKTHLKCWDEFDHHSLVLEEGGVGLVKLGFKVENSSDLDLYEKKAQQFGVLVERMSKGDNLAVGDGVRIVLPSDHVMELYTDIEYVGTETGRLNPDPWPRRGMIGAAVPRLDHALLACDDPALTERFFMEVMDFKASERLITDPSSCELIGSWLFSSQKAHDIALIKGPQGKLHHFAFWLDTWENVLKAGDVFSMDDVPVDVGPTRHGITRGTTIYFFDPSGNRNEVFCGGYMACRDFPTITWTADQIGKGIFYIQRELNDRFTAVYT
jgi:catechol 2,3-dioxygenase